MYVFGIDAKGEVSGSSSTDINFLSLVPDYVIYMKRLRIDRKFD